MIMKADMQKAAVMFYCSGILPRNIYAISSFDLP